MYEPSVRWLRSVVNPQIRAVEAEWLKSSSTPAATYRFWIEAGGSNVPRSLLVKRIEDNWPGDPLGPQREVRFYQIILPELAIAHPHVFYAGREPASEHFVVIMEDVSESHKFPPPTHRWRQNEIEMILRSYARLHASGQTAVPEVGDREWMVDRHESRLKETADDLPQMVDALTKSRIWPNLPRFDQLLDAILREAGYFSAFPTTILHNDVYPPNCGLPKDEKQEVVLLDWEMVGWGLEELDLGFMFLQPYGSHRDLNRAKALDYYWLERQRLGFRLRPFEERQRRQWYADALWALWLIPVAYRMAKSPYPTGSVPKQYWNNMFVVLGDRLQSLSDAV